MRFTYRLPFSEEQFMKGLLGELRRNGNLNIIALLDQATLTVNVTPTYSYYDGGSGRSNAYATYIEFFVNPNNITKLEDELVQSELVSLCDKLIPANCGFDVKGVRFNPDISKDWDTEYDLSLELEGKSEIISNEILKELLPEDLKIKGTEMAEVYTYLYGVENALRIFIRKVGGDQLVYSTPLQKGIDSRKASEAQHKWLSVRGEDDLFYLDFKDLGLMIQNNWNLFKAFFPDQQFITLRIKEMAECRNKVAHNSYISTEERLLMKSYFSTLLAQISSTLK